MVSVYLFHELPPAARAAAAAEMVRAVRPGGIVVIADSNQLGDRPRNDKFAGNFGAFNEPYYRDYISTDLGEFSWRGCMAEWLYGKDFKF